MANIAKVQSEQDKAQEEVMYTLIETLLPKITPMIKPATRKFTEFMTDGNMVVIKAVQDQVHIFHLKENDVESFELKENAQPVGVYAVDDFIEMLLKGNFGQ